ncbi:MAG: response regulator [Ruminococcaceae bacterium]|nr:response regulator [Oscillospiraceae bacterium]
MLQKTFEISTQDEARHVVETLRDIPEVAAAGCSMMRVFVFAFSYDETTELIRPICEAFPQLIVTGLTIHMARPPKSSFDRIIFDENPVLRLGFFFFEHAQVRPLYFTPDAGTPEEIRRAIRAEIAATPNLRGVCVTLAGLYQHISTLLERLTEGFEDIPFFGTVAEVYHIAKRETVPFVFDERRSYRECIALLLYTGEDLHVDAEYIFGWKAIGKAMPVTLAEQEFFMGDATIAAIDGVTPEEIYHKYLGIRFDDYLTVNCCEFPLVVERNGLLIGRTPFTRTEDGSLVFMGSVRAGETLRFSYTVRGDLLADTEKRSREIREFAPQALELFACGNRSFMLREDALLELECFRRIVPGVLHCSAAGEIYYHHGRGELLNSALVAIGMREGEPRSASPDEREPIFSDTPGMRPLSERTLRFMQAMSGDLMQYVQEAQRASQAKSTFLASMSHEIRTPINTILGMDEMILRESSEPETLSYAGDIQSAGRTLLSIINDILDFSKIEEGKMEILPTQYDLGSLVNDLVNMIKPGAAKKGLRLKVEADGDIPHLLFGDEIRIRQCALNILTNAVKYTEKGSVTMRVGYDKRGDDRIALIFSVSDTGIGIRPEAMERLFSPFERIEELRNRSIEGTGLGLNITWQLLTLMGSRLEVESEYGAGSTFSFAVEQDVIRWEPIGSFSEHNQVGAPRKAYRELFHAPDAQVLVVDDTQVNLTMIRSLLKKTQVRVDTAVSGKEALVMAAQRPYDVFFVDHMMPGMDGVETMRALKELPGLADRPYIALTANAISGAREMYLNAGFSDYLSKPVDGIKLEKMLMDHLPAEKVEKADAADAEAADASSAELPDYLREIGELNVEAGLRFCGTAETYLDTLTVFARSAASGADEIESFRRTGDAANATTKVHALKSTSRAIGAVELSALAEQLENAGIAGDAQTLFDGFDELLPRYRALGEALAPLYAAEQAEDGSLPLISDKELRETYDVIRRFAADFDTDRIAHTLEFLKRYRIPETERARIEALRLAIDAFNWDQIDEILDT